MPVDKPTPGNLILTVAELVTVVNAGGGGGSLPVFSTAADVSITSTAGSISLVGSGTSIELDPTAISISSSSIGGAVTISGDNGNTSISMDSSGLQFGSLNIGFYGTFPAPRPQVPAVGVVTVQDLVTALVSIGLITQA